MKVFVTHRRLSNRLISLAAACTLCTTACGADRITGRLEPPPARLVAIAVDEVSMLGDGEPFESGKRTQDVLDVLWRESRWRIIGPGEFRILHADQNDLRRGTDLLLRSRALNLDIEGFALLSVTVGIREARGSTTALGLTRREGNSYESHVSISAALRNIDGEYLAELSTLEKVDPFAERPDWDARPTLRSGIRRLITELIDRCEDCFEPVWRPEFQLRPSPAVLLDARDAGGDSLRQRIERAGPLERDQLLWLNLQYLAPDITLARANVHLEHPTGACFGEDAPEPLPAGGCVARANGDPVRGPHSLAQLPADQPWELEVVSASGERVTVTLPHAP